jgi:hypothetical protein
MTDPLRRGLRPRRIFAGVAVGIGVAIAATAFLSDSGLHGVEAVALVLLGLIVVAYGASALYLTQTTNGRAAMDQHEARRASRR